MRLLDRFLPHGIILLLLMPAASMAEAAEESGTLVVTVENLESESGVVRFVMFASSEDFLERPAKAEIVEIKDQKATWTVEDLAFGTYAVLVHHDLNANGRMERHWYGKPKEPTGTSNNPRPRIGPPRWKKAKFDFAVSLLEISITVQ